MSFQNEKDAERRRKSDQPDEIESSGKSLPKKKKSAGTTEVGSALRTIYQRTIDEDVPPDLLDLLGKLG